LLSEFNAAILSAQLDQREHIMVDRMQTWTTYDAALRPMIERGLIDGMHVPAHCTHNAHMYYIKLQDLETRSRLIEYLRSRGTQTAFHYVPLHSSLAGRKYGVMCGEDKYTTQESERLLRLPLYYGIPQNHVEQVVEGIEKFLQLQ
jgi:dTDP-4-amino-4,6-dideoxygalactose transaminase